MIAESQRYVFRSRPRSLSFFNKGACTIHTYNAATTLNLKRGCTCSRVVFKWLSKAITRLRFLRLVISLRWLPIVFLTARELVSKSSDGASLKKSTRKSHAIKRNELSRNMSTNMASKLVKKNFWNSCASLFQFQNIYRMNTSRCPSQLNTKEESTRFAEASINMSGRYASYSRDPSNRMGAPKQRSLLPHILAVF